MRVRSAVIAAVAAGALLTGCGGGDGGDRLTKEEYIEQADAICAEASAQLDALEEPQSAEDVVEFAEQAVEISEQQLAKLRALRPPEADEATLNEAYDLLERQIELGRQLGEAASEGDTARMQEILQEGERLNEQADQIARDYGLQECGSD